MTENKTRYRQERDVQYIFTRFRKTEQDLRRRPLYPTELRGLIQKIFNFTGLQDSNDSIFRRRTLYPGELRRHNRVILTHGVINVNTAKMHPVSELFVIALDFDFKKADNHTIIHLK